MTHDRRFINDYSMQIPDDVICSLLKQHQTKGIDYMFDKYYRPLVLWAATFVNDIPKSEDLVQDFFVKLWEKDVGRTLLPETLKSFLYTSVHNLALDRLEKKDPLRDAVELIHVRRPWEEYDYFKEEIFQKMKEEIEHLPERSREVITCVYLEGKSYKETAQVLGVAVSTVNTLLVNALKKLREQARDMTEYLTLLFYLSAFERNKEYLQ